MPFAGGKNLARSASAAYLCVVAALLVSLLIAFFGAQYDMRAFRSVLWEREIARLKSHAERTVQRIVSTIEQSPDTMDLTTVRDESWLENYWKQSLDEKNRTIYAAVVSPRGEIIMHSDKSVAGAKLGSQWYERIVEPAEGNIVQTRAESLAGGKRAYDLRVPITVLGRGIGAYHVGIDADRFDHWLDKEQKHILGRRILTFGGIVAVVLLAATSLYFIAIHAARLKRAMERARQVHTSLVGGMAEGVADRVRNPLQAIRLNLRSLERVAQQSNNGFSDKVSGLVESSNEKIEQIDNLTRELIGFSKRGISLGKQSVDVVSSARRVLELREKAAAKRGLEFQTHLPDQPAFAAIGDEQFRAVMEHLLDSAERACAGGGRIEVQIKGDRKELVLEVIDDGPCVPEQLMGRLFDPFFEAGERKQGLELALVKYLVEGFDGRISGLSCSPRGLRITCVLPLAKRNKGTPSHV